MLRVCVYFMLAKVGAPSSPVRERERERERKRERGRERGRESCMHVHFSLSLSDQ